MKNEIRKVSAKKSTEILKKENQNRRTASKKGLSRAEKMRK